MPATPWLSVVMPTFNGAAFVGQALDSLVAANDPGVEVVVVDDGSADETVDIVRDYDGTLRLRLERGDPRGSWVAATNAGIALATADRVTFLHQDDVWLPGRLDAVRELVCRAPDAAMLVHAARFLSPSGADVGAWTLPFPGAAGTVSGADFVERLLVQNFLCIAAPVFGREDVVRTGRLDERLWYTADWDLWLRLAGLGRVAYDARALVGFRVHPGSQTARRSVDQPAFRQQLLDVFDRHFDTWASGPQRPARPVRRAALASIELNTALAAMSHHAKPRIASLLRAMVSLRVGGARRLVRDSRLSQRLGARLRARRNPWD